MANMIGLPAKADHNVNGQGPLGDWTGELSYVSSVLWYRLLKLMSFFLQIKYIHSMFCHAIISHKLKEIPRKSSNG